MAAFIPLLWQLEEAKKDFDRSTRSCSQSLKRLDDTYQAITNNDKGWRDLLEKMRRDNDKFKQSFPSRSISAGPNS